MTTAVISPSGFQSLPGLGWNGRNSNACALPAMNSDESSRMLLPTRKTVTRSSSSSSLASNSSTSSTSTITPAENSGTPQMNGDTTNNAQKKKQRGGFWPVSKAESTSGVSNARASAVQTGNPNALNGLTNKTILQPPQSNANGTRAINGQAGAVDQVAILALIPMNGTFERKQINVPFAPEIVKIGRQTNAKTVPTQVNGFFDSKVLSRQHAEIWAERSTGKIWIRDVKSSNGTFVNGQRLSPENRESEPHELRQHDTLELGIDIVSEDQKTIVHHKVSAKVEYAGLPGTSNNILDLNFGDLDPSLGSSMLISPMSQPMMQSRSKPGGLPNGRISTPSSISGGLISSASQQQRQQNFYGSPLNIEQLVRHLATEMRAAKQQTQDLEHANTFLNSMIVSDGTSSKLQPPPAELSLGRLHTNGRPRPSRIDHATRFGDPPAPPPQQPLPEKPDSAKSSPITTASLDKSLKRSDTAKPVNGSSHSPTGSDNSQILQLLQALDNTKKQLDSQSSRVKQLEDMLKQERSAREAAEEKARRFEETAKFRPVSHAEQDTNTTTEEPIDESSNTSTLITNSSELLLQQRLEQMVTEMQTMKMDMEQASRRADSAESDASSARSSLAEMIERLRKENEDAQFNEDGQPRSEMSIDSRENHRNYNEDTAFSRNKHDAVPNGHISSPSKFPGHLQRAVATVLKQKHGSGDITAQSAPLVSMLGVVLIGVGLMAYLNSWKKGDK